MATVYTELRKEVNKRGESAIRIVIVVDRKVSRIKSGYYVAAKYWDDRKLRIKPSHPNAIEYNDAIDTKVQQIRAKYASLDAAGRGTTAKKLGLTLRIGDTFSAISKHFSNKFREAGQIGTADRYDSIATQIEHLFPKLKAVDMNEEWAEQYREKLKGQAHNTIVGKLRNLNAILNKAVASGFLAANNLEGVKVGSFHHGEKASLSFDELEKLWNARPVSKWGKIARAAFLFSYYTTGARFKDVLLMPKSAIYKEDAQTRIKWKPSKTERSSQPKWIDVEVCPRLEHIIQSVNNPTDTIFGLINPTLPAGELDKRIDAVQSNISKELKTVIAKAGIGKYITFHCARVTLIRHMDEVSNRQTLTIKDAVGHSKAHITEGYIGKDQRAIDRLTRVLYGI